MFKIQHIIQAIQDEKIRITNHADEEANADKLTLIEIIESVCDGEIIEEYPTDMPYPSCLICGMNKNGEPIHSVWAYNKENEWAVLVTVYRPDPQKWINWKIRRQKR